MTMLLAYRLMAISLRKLGYWKQYLDYKRTRLKIESTRLRIRFLETCWYADIIPKFLNFRIPNNGCFDETAVHTIQRNLLKK